MKKSNLAIIGGILAILISVGWFLGGAPSEERSWETPNTNGGATETKTITQQETVTRLIVGEPAAITINHTETIEKTFTNVEPPITLTVTATKTIYANRTVPAFENNTAWSIDRLLLDRLNTARDLRGLDSLHRNRELASMAELNKVAAWTEETNQIFTLTSYTLTRDLDECWRGDLHVAETILTKLGEDYDWVIYSPTTHGVGIHVDVDLYKIYVRCVFLGA